MARAGYYHEVAPRHVGVRVREVWAEGERYSCATSPRRQDGKWVLTTNNVLPSDEVALAYKRLWRVEQGSRHLKSGPVCLSTQKLPTVMLEKSPAL